MSRILGTLTALVVASSLLLVVPISAQPGGEHAAAKRQAQTAAEAWLTLVDDDKFAASWDSAAALFRERVERDGWVQRGQQLRDTVQAPSTRTLATTQYRDSLQRASGSGPFVILKYRSSFGAGRFEELLLTVREDTTWKVTGYQVTPLRPPGGRSAPSPDSSRP